MGWNKAGILTRDRSHRAGVHGRRAGSGYARRTENRDECSEQQDGGSAVEVASLSHAEAEIRGRLWSWAESGGIWV